MHCQQSRSGTERLRFLAKILICVGALPALHAETALVPSDAAWLRYEPRDFHPPAVIVSTTATAAVSELVRGLHGITGHILRIETSLPNEDGIVVATVPNLPAALGLHADLAADAYWLKTVSAAGHRYTVITGADERGVLYGVFAFLRKLAVNESVAQLDDRQAPYAPIRWVNQWDNLDGSVERGYGGRSIFWIDGHAREDLTRVSDYGRLLASLGINGCTINNVNANPRMLDPALLPGIARIAEAFRPWGVRVSIAVDFGSPKSIGGLDTFDPLDPKVADWWMSKGDELYRAVPDLAGFVLKADSEGRVGPANYGRTHADAANLLARALEPHGGIVLYRGFVYNHHMDWRDPHNDRARAAADNFQPLDGKFDNNVVIQIKNGPIDFQVREPVSPLFGSLERTNTALELQVTQEYAGQGRSLVFLVPQWKTALDFDLRATGPDTPLKALAAGKVFHRPLGGFVGVANVGLDDSWFGSDLSQANLYGFGRLAWDPNLTSERIADEWTRQTFRPVPEVVRAVRMLLLESWRAYEDYTGPLGLQTLTDIVGNHYGVAVEASEHNGWGQWHNADEHGVGMDRTVATGTGYTGQYRPSVARTFESLATCPDDLLLFFHHVSYSYVLHSGKTVIQSIYDSHYAGAKTVAGWLDAWKVLAGKVDGVRYRAILDQLSYQAGQGEEWRDAVTMWFFRESHIPDAQGRVGNYASRYEAESMELAGYTPIDVHPRETASGGKAVICSSPLCSAQFRFDGKPGWYNVRVRYFDQNNGSSHFRLLVNKQPVEQWTADNHLPTVKLDGTSSSLCVVHNVPLRPGDEIRVEGSPDGGESAALDYIELAPAPRS